MNTMRYPDLWKSVLQNEMARAMSGEGPEDFFAARAAYERMAAERDRLPEEGGRRDEVAPAGI